MDVKVVNALFAPICSVPPAFTTTAPRELPVPANRRTPPFTVVPPLALLLLAVKESVPLPDFVRLAPALLRALARVTDSPLVLKLNCWLAAVLKRAE